MYMVARSLAACLFLLTVAQSASAAENWYSWPSKERVFWGLGEPVTDAKAAEYIHTVNGVQVCYSAEMITVSFRLPDISEMPTGADLVDWLTRKTQPINETCETLLANIFPYWDGAYRSLISLWAQYEKTQQAPCLAFNQFWICQYRSWGNHRFVAITPRKDFNAAARAAEIAKRGK